jgi:hypothetical protein
LIISPSPGEILGGGPLKVKGKAVPETPEPQMTQISAYLREWKQRFIDRKPLIQGCGK